MNVLLSFHLLHCKEITHLHSLVTTLTVLCCIQIKTARSLQRLKGDVYTLIYPRGFPFFFFYCHLVSPDLFLLSLYLLIWSF